MNIIETLFTEYIMLHTVTNITQHYYHISNKVSFQSNQLCIQFVIVIAIITIELTKLLGRIVSNLKALSNLDTFSQLEQRWIGGKGLSNVITIQSNQVQ